MVYLKRWLPAILLCLFIFASSATPGAQVSANQDVDFFAHKSIHVAIYSMLFLALLRATKRSPIAAVLAILYGASDEFHQTFVLSRTGSIRDFLIDSGAVFITAVILWKYSHLLPNRLKSWLSE
jgi:VanZ family protein